MVDIGSKLGSYEIREPLGKGGMGEVYLAFDSRLRREVAIKMLSAKLAGDERAMARFRREAHLLAALNHPNIATIFGVEEWEGQHYLVLELVEGESLSKLLRRGAPSLADALAIGLQVAKALEAAHRKDIIHRDLKPGNVMVSAEKVVKVLDFGLATALKPTEEETEVIVSPAGSRSEISTAALDVTLAGDVVGTIPYMSPEQIRGRNVDWRSDIWAFGCLLFETLTGRMAFGGHSSRIETASAILALPPQWERLPESVPAPVRELVGHCLMKEAEERLQSMREARLELEAALYPYLAPDQPPSAVRGRARPPSVADVASSPSSSLSYLDSLGHFTIVERLGAGGVGEVYRARDLQMDRDVAVKVLRPGALADPAARERLAREAEALSRLKHPNIANFLEYDSQDGIDYLVTEFVRGESLGLRLAEGPRPESEVAGLGSQVAGALAAAHERGVLHRDLKPGNVLVSPEGTVKVVDFGLAEFTAASAVPTTSGSSSRHSTIRGPLPYQAPELLREEEADHRADLYALGVILYQMATGKRPFPEDSADQLTDAVLTVEPEPPSRLVEGISAELDRIVLRCLAKDPRRRYQSADAVAEDLERLGGSKRDAGWWRRAAGSWPRVAMAAALLVALGAAVFFARRERGSPPEPAPRVVDSVVVMPSRLLMPDAEPYLADAIPNTISSQLSRVPGLETRVPPTALAVERAGGDVGEVARSYGASAYVVPTLTSHDDDIVLTLQLVDTSNQSLLWSREYTGAADSFLELAHQAAQGVLVALRPTESFTPGAGAGPSAEAENLLQQGLYYSHLYANLGRAGDFDRARSFLEQAFEVEPRLADASAELAMLYAARLTAGVSILEVQPEIERWAERTLSIDPENSKAWAALSLIEAGRTPESYRKKLEYALKAATYGPREGWAHNRLSVPLGMQSHELGLAAARQASRMAPLDLIDPLYEATFLLILGRPEEALERIDYSLAREPDMPFGLLVRSLALTVADRPRDSLDLVARLEPLVAQGRVHPAWLQLARDLASLTLAVESGAPEVDEVRQRLVAMARGETPFPRWEVSTRRVIAQLARLGFGEEAIDLLRYRSAHGIRDTYDFLVFNPDLESLTGDPRLRGVIAEARTDFDRMVAILEEARDRGELPSYLIAPLSDLLARIRRERAAA